MNDTDRSPAPPPPTALAAMERYVSAAADFYARGRTCTPTDLPDVAWCSLEGLAHTAGRCREDVSPAELVLRWREVSLTRQRAAVERPEPLLSADDLELWSSPERAEPHRVEPAPVEHVLSGRARLLILLASIALGWVVVGLVGWGVLALVTSW